jgi:ParB-like chromosome segregation protein Spo0J
LETVKISRVIPNEDNPRYIKEDKFKKLVQSLKDFPEMAAVRPIVVNKEMVALGGNMRLKAMQEAGWSEVPVKIVDWSEEKQREFIIKDNVGFGEWDWDELANTWETEELNEWGMDVWRPEKDVDYSILDEEDVDDQLEGMADGVKKAIQIEFKAEHYKEAYQLVKSFRDAGGYVGGMIMEFLKAEKSKG